MTKIIKEAVILAGGKGSRLKSILGDNPKPMIDFDGIPLIHHQINSLLSYQFNRINILTSYKSDVIKSYIYKNIICDDIFFYEDLNPLGTSGSFLNIIENFSDKVLVLYGDTLFDVNLSRFEKFHDQNLNCVASIFLHPNSHPYDSDIITLDDKNYVDKFYNYPHKENLWLPNLVNAAMYFLNTNKLLKYRDFKKPSDFAKDFFPFLLDQGEKIRGYVSSEYIKDVGTPERYKKTLYEYIKKIPQMYNLNKKQKAIFIDRDGTINQLKSGDVKNANELNLYENIGDAIKKLNDANYKVIIITNQPVIAKNKCSLNSLKIIHNKIETLIGLNGAYIDRFYFCPHYPESGFIDEIKELKIKCDCRKPNIGLFKKAIEDFNIDIDNSWFIGDSSTDLYSAKKINIKFITVKTGLKGMDYIYPLHEEFTSTNFNDAVNFILKDYKKIKLNVKPITEKIKRSKSKNFFFYGLSRSGKSTICNIIKNTLLDSNVDSQLISLDGWLLDEKHRGKNVYERYDVDKILEIYKNLNSLKHKSIHLNVPVYNKILKTSLPCINNIKISESTIILWEGVIAGHIAEILSIDENDIFYIECNENDRNLKIYDEYLSRGYDIHKIKKIMLSRQADEVNLIKSNHSKKNTILNYDSF